MAAVEQAELAEVVQMRSWVAESRSREMLDAYAMVCYSPELGSNLPSDYVPRAC